MPRQRSHVSSVTRLRRSFCVAAKPSCVFIESGAPSSLTGVKATRNGPLGVECCSRDEDAALTSAQGTEQDLPPLLRNRHFVIAVRTNWRLQLSRHSGDQQSKGGRRRRGQRMCDPWVGPRTTQQRLRPLRYPSVRCRSGLWVKSSAWNGRLTAVIQRDLGRYGSRDHSCNSASAPLKGVGDVAL